MAEIFVPTVRVKNLTKRTIKETFPVIGTVEVRPGATKRIPRDVALAWTNPSRYAPGTFATTGGVPIKILDDAEDESKYVTQPPVADETETDEEETEVENADE